MKLDHLMARAETLEAKRVADRAEKVVLTIDHDDLPQVLIKFEDNKATNISLKMKMLVDDGLPASHEGRMLEIRLYSDRSLQAFFDLVDDVREMVNGGVPIARATTSNPPLPF